MEDFVTFEIAKKLKEKGFKEQCLAYYTKDSDFYYNNSYGSDVENAFKSFNSRPNHICGKRIDAPIIYQVLKWLREEKLILIGLSPMQEYDVEETIEWCATVYKADKQGGLSLKEELYYESYEQAALASIEYVLDNLI